MVYHAKVDVWIAALLGGAALLEVGAGTAVLVSGVVAGAMPLALALTIGLTQLAIGVLIGLLVWACYGARYEVTPTDLVIRFGPLRTVVPLAAIIEVFPTRNPVSAPAPSLDRLHVSYRLPSGLKWFALISPEDKAGFVRDLAGAAPQLRQAGALRLAAEAPA